MTKRTLVSMTAAAALAALACLAGCQEPPHPAAAAVVVPPPLNLLLPQKIRITPFTGARAIDERGLTGLDVRIEAVDSYGDSTKAFGRFRFELFVFQPTKPDGRGERLASWSLDLENPQINRDHWNNIARCYQFKLGWSEPIPVGKQFVLVATYESRFGNRLFDQKIFQPGQ